MLEYKVKKISEHITQILDPTEVSCFLVVGTERALLIDTGVGLKGLKENVEKLTSLPLDVALTHGHVDHACGAALFDSVYLAEVDRDMAVEQCKEMRYSYSMTMFGILEKMTGVKKTCSREDFVPEIPESFTFKDMTDGMEFDLGGVTVKVIAVPGHTKGTCCMLVKEDRVILFGDACNMNTLVGGPESTTISEYKKSLLYLKTFESEFDMIMYSHGPVVGPSALDDNIELCDKILAGTDDKVPEIGILGAGFVAAKRREGGFGRADGKVGNIFYSELTAK